MRRSNKGFTLIELLIVMVIIGLLASLVAPKMFSKVGSSKVKTAKAQIYLFETALDAYRLDVGRYPPSLDELLQSKVNGWDGPYLPKRVPKDPWGRAYLYQVPGANNNPYKLGSLGRDGKRGGKGEDQDIFDE